MGRELQGTSHGSLPAIDTQEPSTLLFLPPWLATQIEVVSDLGAGRTTVDTKTGAITARVATIPKSKMPTGAQRRAIERRVTELQDALHPGPMTRTLTIIGGLVTEHASARLDADTADIKIDAYRDALDDLPAWAIREAVRRWRRGDVQGVASHDLDFAPKPARLRRIAQGIADVARGQALRLQRVLDAEPEEALTEAEREANEARFKGVLKMLAAPPSVPEPEPEDVQPPREVSLTDELEARRIAREAEDAKAATGASTTEGSAA